MIRPATTRRTAAAVECAYCDFAASEGAVLVAVVLTDEHALCTGCAAHLPECALPGTHGDLCDCASGLCD